ncbi:hypothetical protein [Streptomyces sp. SAI-25]|uniref:hypothetical protein n=1 Tax=Streptomyces sp. SAI-25 TaxID=1472664 RepID=UPI00403A791C
MNYYNHERPHATLSGRPPISRTAGSDFLIVFDQPPEPFADIPQQLAFEALRNQGPETRGGILQMITVGGSWWRDKSS